MRTKNLILIPLLFIAMAMPVDAQQLHAIIFADTKDANVGLSDLQDFYNISVEVSTIAAATGMRLKTYYYKDEKCSNSNLRNVLDNLQTNKEDIILFYYTGHGTRSAEDTSIFPQMCLGSHSDANFYPLEKVLMRLEQQPARLKVVLGDCCNNVVRGVSPKNYHTKGATVLTKEPVSVYQCLFTGNKGFVIASGSQAGETSAACYNNDGSPIGGAFTNSLLATLKDCAAKGMETTWNDVMQNARGMTLNTFGHTPVYNSSVKDAEAEDEIAEVEAAPAQTTEYHEPQNIAQDSEEEEVENIVILTAIANENLPIDARVKIQDKALAALFASPDTKVEVVGSNGNTIVATERAEDFVLRMCTAHNLINLVEVDATADSNGRYTYLKVHEIYKR